jgi:ElaB/YqjD/DUF883 family membrane-anchored ribosome-binding protein
MSSDNSARKFEEALHLLNEAAREKKDEIQQLLGDKFTHIRSAIEEVADRGRDRYNRVREVAEEAIEFGGEKARRAASEVDEKVKQNPWPYIGGVAMGALLLGFILGASRNNK